MVLYVDRNDIPNLCQDAELKKYGDEDVILLKDFKGQHYSIDFDLWLLEPYFIRTKVLLNTLPFSQMPCKTKYSEPEVIETLYSDAEEYLRDKLCVTHTSS